MILKSKKSKTKLKEFIWGKNLSHNVICITKTLQDIGTFKLNRV